MGKTHSTLHRLSGRAAEGLGLTTPEAINHWRLNVVGAAGFSIDLTEKDRELFVRGINVPPGSIRLEGEDIRRAVIRLLRSRGKPLVVDQKITERLGLRHLNETKGVSCVVEGDCFRFSYNQESRLGAASVRLGGARALTGERSETVFESSVVRARFCRASHKNNCREQVWVNDREVMKVPTRITLTYSLPGGPMDCLKGVVMSSTSVDCLVAVREFLNSRTIRTVSGNALDSIEMVPTLGSSGVVFETR